MYLAFRVRQSWVQILTLLHTGCISLDKLLNLSESQCAYNADSMHFVELVKAE